VAPLPAATTLVAVRERLGARTAVGTLAVDPSMATPNAFFWRASTDEAWPKVERGDFLLMDPDRVPVLGDLVGFEDHGTDRLRTYSLHGEEVRLSSPRAEVPPLRVPRATFRPLGVVRWILRAL
jgi:hypothetical protein